MEAWWATTHRRDRHPVEAMRALIAVGIGVAILFGTHDLPDGTWPAAFRIAGNPVPEGDLPQLLHPFRNG